MKLEIFGKTIIIESRQKRNGENCIKNIHKNTKSIIFSSIQQGLTEGAILSSHESVIGWWSIKSISKNPLLI